MEVLENREQWYPEFEAGWLAHFNATGETNWKIYNIPRNRTAPGTPGIDLSKSRLALITSAGGYLTDSQEVYDAENDLGDYSIRLFSKETDPSAISFAHTHYNHADVDADQQVLVPLGHLRDLVNEGVIGEVADNVISYMGYQPNVMRTLDETIPVIVAAAKQQEVHAALLVPA